MNSINMEASSSACLNPFDEGKGPVHEAMAFVEDCSAYMQAVSTCPELIQAESPPSQYLAFCQFDPWEAAKRLALYWKLRLAVFGSPSAFVPMAQALTAQDKAWIVQGEHVVLPPDRFGRIVALFDRSRVTDAWDSTNSMACQARCSTFLLHPACQQARRRLGEEEEESTPRDAMAVITLSTKMRGPIFNAELMEICRQLLTQATCIRVAEMHLVAVARNGQKGALRVMMDTVAPIICQKFGLAFGGPKIVLHSGLVSEVLASLEAHGFEAKNLPTTVGGEWSYETDWLDFLQSQGVSLPQPLRLNTNDPPTKDCSRELANSQTQAASTLTKISEQSVASLQAPADGGTSFLPPTRSALSTTGGAAAAFARDGCRSTGTASEAFLLLRTELLARPTFGPSSSSVADSLQDRELFTRKISNKQGSKQPSVLGCKDPPHVSSAEEARTPTGVFRSQGGASSRSPFEEHPVHEGMSCVGESKAYREAVFRCPDVVAGESPHSGYLSFCKNSGDAARRLARYWTLRRDLFGPTAAFLPLSEALSTEDKAFLASDAVRVIPSSCGGLPAVFVDRRKLSSSMLSAACLRRCMFAVLHGLSQIAADCGTDKSVYVAGMRGNAGGAKSFVDLGRYVKLLLDEAMCIHIVELHAVVVDDRSSFFRYVLNTLLPVLVARARDIFGDAPKMFTHSGTPEAIIKSLRAKGFLDECVPAELGGTWLCETSFRDMLLASRKHEQQSVQGDTREEPVSRIASWSQESAAGARAATADAAGPGPGRHVTSNEEPHLAHYEAMAGRRVPSQGNRTRPLPPAETPRQTRQNLSPKVNLVHEAMAFVENCAAYMRAVDMCPDVVRVESNPEAFLQYSAENQWDAASRLAAYWQLRVQVFGARGYQPLTDALTKAEWQSLKQCYRAVLPPDSQGRSVVYLDRERQLFLNPASSAETQIRCAFVVLHLICNSPRTSKDVVALLRISSNSATGEFDKEVGEMARIALTQAMCGKLASVHTISIGPTRPPHLVIRKRFGDRVAAWINGVSIVRHTGTNKQVICSLLKHGLEWRNLPSQVGGGLDVETAWPVWLKRNFWDDSSSPSQEARLSKSTDDTADSSDDLSTIDGISFSNADVWSGGQLLTAVFDSSEDSGNGSDRRRERGRTPSTLPMAASHAPRLPTRDTAAMKSIDVFVPAGLGQRKRKSSSSSVRHNKTPRPSSSTVPNALAFGQLIAAARDPPRAAKRARLGKGGLIALAPTATPLTCSLGTVSRKDAQLSASKPGASSPRKGSRRSSTTDQPKKQNDAEIARSVESLMEARRAKRSQINKEYNRRKQAQYKAKLTFLSEQVGDLQQKRADLTAENRRLQGLVREADGIATLYGLQF